MSNLDVTGNLTVRGTSTLNKSLTLRENSFVSGFLRVGSLAAVGYNVLEIAQVNQELTVTGNCTFQSALAVLGQVDIAGPLIVDDLIRTNTPHGIVCGGELQVAQDATLQETLTVQGNGIFQSALAVKGQVDVAGPLIVDDLIRTNTPNGIVCGGQLQVAQNATLQGTLTLQGAAAFQAGATCTGGPMVTAGGTYSGIAILGNTVTLGTAAAGVINIASSVTRTINLDPNVAFGTVLTILVYQGNNVRIVAPDGGSIEIFTAWNSSSSVSGIAIKSSDYASIQLTQTNRNFWVALNQMGAWSLAP